MYTNSLHLPFRIFRSGSSCLGLLKRIRILKSFRLWPHFWRHGHWWPPVLVNVAQERKPSDKPKGPVLIRRGAADAVEVWAEILVPNLKVVSKCIFSTHREKMREEGVYLFRCQLMISDYILWKYGMMDSARMCQKQKASPGSSLVRFVLDVFQVLAMPCRADPNAMQWPAMLGHVVSGVSGFGKAPQGLQPLFA